MSHFYTIKHSFNAGDLITLLPGIQHIYQSQGKKTKLYQRLNFKGRFYPNAINHIEEDGEAICMNQQIFDMLHPLISYQEYIESFEVWQGEQVDFDVDLTRDSKWIPMPAGLIHHWAWALEPAMACDLSKVWLDVELTLHYSRNIIINRTERYQNPYITYFFLKDYESQLIFSGTEREHQSFCMQNNLQIPYLKVNDFLELARKIYECKFFIGNQSFNFHLSDAMKIPRILELCPAFPNTFPTGENGYAFYHQKSLQYYFEKLINETA